MYDDILGPVKSFSDSIKKEEKRKSVNNRIIEDTIKHNKMKSGNQINGRICK